MLLLFFVGRVPSKTQNSRVPMQENPRGTPNPSPIAIAIWVLSLLLPWTTSTARFVVVPLGRSELEAKLAVYVLVKLCSPANGGKEKGSGNCRGDGLVDDSKCFDMIEFSPGK